MYAAIKRFTQESTDLQLMSISLLAAMISLRLSFLSAIEQFVATSFIIGSWTWFFYQFKHKSSSELVFGFLNTAAIVYLAYSIAKVIAVFFILSLVVSPLKKGFNNLYFKAFIFHVLDAGSTYISQSSEANPFVAFLMNQVGEISALIFSKTLLVGIPLLYVERKMGETEGKFFAKTVLILGITLSARNLYILIS